MQPTEMSVASEAILRIAVAAPLYTAFDYLPPPGVDAQQLQPGQRLEVPFGRGRRMGLLLEVLPVQQASVAELKQALQLLDDAPCVSAEWLRLLRWMAGYYHQPVGEVMATFLPVALRARSRVKPPVPQAWRCSTLAVKTRAEALQRSPKQRALLAWLQAQADAFTPESLTPAFKDAAAALRLAKSKGWVEPALPPCAAAQPGPALNPEQQQAVAAILAAEGFTGFLLDGITGSGKTEVYLQSIAKVLAAGRQALVLVPEIALTPQLLQRFEQRLGVPMAALHSGLAQGERLRAWCAARDGQARVVIGTRSAVITPMPQLGMIVVDEEHDASYKQQDGVRYNARDVAVRRAHQAGIPIVLGSATPSLESLNNARQGRYQALHLRQRTGVARLPRISTLDLRRSKVVDGLSLQLLDSIRRHADNGGQSLLFLNRRGYAPTWLCSACGWMAECSHCDARMILHKGMRRLRCHHCGSQRVPEKHCPDCGSDQLSGLGEGTERIEVQLAEALPQLRIARIDRDSTRRKGSLERLLAQAEAGAIDVLVGTQMLAKGHDFPKLTLAAIVGADAGLFSADLRASERLGQLLLQVAGRAGRAEQPGEVIIQTHVPEHPLLQLLLRQGYPAFAQQLLQERQAAGWPPFGHLALLRAQSGKHAEAATAFLDAAATLAQTLSAQISASVGIWGPAPAPRERIAGQWRAQLLLQAANRNSLQRLLGQWAPQLGSLPSARRVRWSLDVDPQQLD